MLNPKRVDGLHLLAESSSHVASRCHECSHLIDGKNEEQGGGLTGAEATRGLCDLRLVPSSPLSFNKTGVYPSAREDVRSSVARVSLWVLGNEVVQTGGQVYSRLAPGD